MIACETGKNKVSDHFPKFRKMVYIVLRAKRKTIDYRLSRIVCYLIVKNKNSYNGIINKILNFYSIIIIRKWLYD